MRASFTLAIIAVVATAQETDVDNQIFMGLPAHHGTGHGFYGHGDAHGTHHGDLSHHGDVYGHGDLYGHGDHHATVPHHDAYAAPHHIDAHDVPHTYHHQDIYYEEPHRHHELTPHEIQAAYGAELEYDKAFAKETVGPYHAAL